MKIRIKGNSLRLRLVRSEVKRLQEEGQIEEAIAFGPAERLGYRLDVDASVDRITARFEASTIRVSLPPHVAREWASTDLVSLVEDQPLGNGEVLKLLVEKDFTCINPRAVWQEDQSDNYPNPNPSCGASHV